MASTLQLNVFSFQPKGLSLSLIYNFHWLILSEDQQTRMQVSRWERGLDEEISNG